MRRAIAFYLPQFHPIPENDEWWGKNFTEWRNVARGQPQFPGHVQPNLPGDLGYYDLRVADVQRQQVDLAKEYGLYGFCFYYYWFQGKRLLEYPLDRYVGDEEIDFPFCLCWANETWSRRWDGSESEILIKQIYSDEYAKEIFNDFARYMQDPRYIEIDGQKIISIYRAADVPQIHLYVDVWRRCAEERGWKLLICSCLTFGAGDPTAQGFDAAIQFPPHGVVAKEVTAETNVNSEFVGKVYSYASVVSNQIADPLSTFPLFRGVMPSWDNTARRMERAHIYAGHSPELFSIWLNDAFEKTLSDSDGNNYIFINAWNEWAEGAFLEPDAQYGRARLEALRFSVTGGGRPESALQTLEELAQLASGGIAVSLRRSLKVLKERECATREVMQELRSLVMKERSPYELFSPILPTQTPFLTSERTVFLPTAIGSFDRIGSRSFENGMKIEAAKTLYISGWTLPAAEEIPFERNHLIIVATAPNGRTFFYETDRFERRGDVADSFPSWSRERALFCGFSLNLVVRRPSPRGIYDRRRNGMRQLCLYDAQSAPVRVGRGLIWRTLSVNLGDSAIIQASGIHRGCYRVNLPPNVFSN